MIQQSYATFNIICQLALLSLSLFLNFIYRLLLGIENKLNNKMTNDYYDKISIFYKPFHFVG